MHLFILFKSKIIVFWLFGITKVTMAFVTSNLYARNTFMLIAI